jgi:hypothetical protein
MSKNLFLPNWKNFVDNTLVDCIINHLESDDSMVLKDFNFLDYTRGITFNDELRENGMYFFRFSDGKYYIGKASSCTMLERIAKHIDGRKVGGFNGVLRNLIPVSDEQKHFPQNQQEFLKTKVVLLPVSNDLNLLNNITNYSGNLLFHLEKDLIHAFKIKLGREILRNGKFPNGFSGYFNLWKTNKK